MHSQYSSGQANPNWTVHYTTSREGRLFPTARPCATEQDALLAVGELIRKNYIVPRLRVADPSGRVNRVFAVDPAVVAGEGIVPGKGSLAAEQSAILVATPRRMAPERVEYPDLEAAIDDAASRVFSQTMDPVVLRRPDGRLHAVVSGHSEPGSAWVQEGADGQTSVYSYFDSPQALAERVQQLTTSGRSAVSEVTHGLV